KAKKQTVVSRSSIEAEYRAMCNVCCEVMWIKKILVDLQVNIGLPVEMDCDNNSAIQISNNRVLHERSKHFEIDLYFLGETIDAGLMKPVKVKSENNIADLFTKGLFISDHNRKRDSSAEIVGCKYNDDDDIIYTSLIELRLLSTHTSPKQTPPQTTPQTNLQTTPQSTPPTPLSTPSPQTTPTPPTTPPPPPPPPPTWQHHMVTRSKFRIVKANPKYNLHVTSSSPIPKSLFHALQDSNWKQAMCDEYKALIDNNTWVLVPRPPNVNIVRSMWLYKHKYNTDGSLNRYKARLVTNGHSQQQGIDCDETFSHVVEPATIRTVLNLTLFRSATSQLIAYSDADWAGCSATLRSTSGYCVFLGDNLLTWSSKRKDTLFRCSAKAEYYRVANAVAEASWIRNLLRELHTLLFTATLVCCDNVSAVYMSAANPVQHQRIKHVEIDIHFVRDKVAADHIRVLHVPYRFQYADIFTKRLTYPLFADFRSSLSVRKYPAPTAGAY
nr:ribonuclease H-like domain-containing protein [Tanacetum cinerariifolium]